MKLCLLINPNHHWQDALDQALALALAADGKNMVVHSVFFYAEAVQLIQHPERQIEWQQLQSNQGTRLMLCRTMMEHFDLPSPAADGFEVVGMASLTNAMEQADRTVELS